MFRRFINLKVLGALDARYAIGFAETTRPDLNDGNRCLSRDLSAALLEGDEARGLSNDSSLDLSTVPVVGSNCRYTTALYRQTVRCGDVGSPWHF